MQIDIPDQVNKTVDGQKAGIVYERPTILGAILDSELSPEDKTPPRIADEALAVVGAGVSTYRPLSDVPWGFTLRKQMGEISY